MRIASAWKGSSRILVVPTICAVALGVPAGSGASRGSIGPAAAPPSPCVAGVYCTELIVEPGNVEPNRSPGNGRITSTPPGIDCTFKLGVPNGVCAHTFAWHPAGGNTRDVLLTATADGDSFVSYSSPQSTTAEQVERITSGVRTTVFRAFTLKPWPVEVTKSGLGSGRVTGGGIDCGPVCKADVDPGTKIDVDGEARCRRGVQDLDRRLQRTSSHLHAHGHEGESRRTRSST